MARIAAPIRVLISLPALPGRNDREYYGEGHNGRPGVCDVTAQKWVGGKTVTWADPCPLCHDPVYGYGNTVSAHLLASFHQFACTGANWINGIIRRRGTVTRCSGLAEFGDWGQKTNLNPDHDKVHPYVVMVTMGADTSHSPTSSRAASSAYWRTDQRPPQPQSAHPVVVPFSISNLAGLSPAGIRVAYAGIPRVTSVLNMATGRNGAPDIGGAPITIRGVGLERPSSKPRRRQERRAPLSVSPSPPSKATTPDPARARPPPPSRTHGKDQGSGAPMYAVRCFQVRAGSFATARQVLLSPPLP